MNKNARTEAALNQLGDALNVMGGEAANQEAVTSWFRHLHRTLQQQFMKTVVMSVLRELDTEYINGWTDKRNEAAAKAAHKMLEALEVEDTYFPLI